MAGYSGVAATVFRVRWILLLVVALTAMLLLAHPAFAQAAAPGTGPIPASPQTSALNRALGQVSGDGKSLSLSLQILILMSLLTVLP